MTTEIFPTAAEANRLTEVLRHCGALDAVRVGDIEVVNSLVKQRSHTRRLRLSYEGATGDALEFLILKMGHLDSAGRPAYANRREIAFYRDIVPSLPAGVVPRCFEVVESTDTTPWHLLLEDLSDSHVLATEHPLPPSQAQCESIMVAWAKFHAAWWDDPRLRHFGRNMAGGRLGRISADLCTSARRLYRPVLPVHVSRASRTLRTASRSRIPSVGAAPCTPRSDARSRRRALVELLRAARWQRATSG